MTAPDLTAEQLAIVEHFERTPSPFDDVEGMTFGVRLVLVAVVPAVVGVLAVVALIIWLVFR